MRDVRHLKLLGKPVDVGDDVETVWQQTAAGLEFVAPQNVRQLARGLAQPRYGRILRMFQRGDTTWLQVRMFEPVVIAGGALQTHPWTQSPMLRLAPPPAAPAAGAAAVADPRVAFIPADMVHALVHVRHNCYMLAGTHGGRQGGGPHPCTFQALAPDAVKDAWQHHIGNDSWYLNQFVHIC